MATVGGVVAAVRGTAVVRHGVQVVPARRTAATVGRVVAHVQSFQGEVHGHAQFASETFCRREPL